MGICYCLGFQCKLSRGDVVSLPWERMCVCVWGDRQLHHPHSQGLVKLAIAHSIRETGASVQLCKETKSHFWRVPDCPGLFSKVLCSIFSIKIGVNCAHSGEEWAGHCRAKIGIVRGMKFLFPDVVWVGLTLWTGFLFKWVYFSLLQISFNSSAEILATLLGACDRELDGLGTCLLTIAYLFCWSFCLALPALPLGCHLSPCVTSLWFHLLWIISFGSLEFFSWRKI